MRIHSQQHVWRYNPEECEWIDESISILPEDLEPELEQAGFDCSIRVQARQILEETRWRLRLAEQERTIAGVIGWVDPRSSDVKVQL